MRIFMVDASGSPLQARASNSSNVIMFALIGAIVVAIFFVIRFVLKTIKELHQTPEWIEKEKKRLTKKADVEKVADNFKMTKNETQILWNACKAQKAPNIFYLIQNAEAVDNLFKAEFFALKELNTNPNYITELFRLRHKIEQIVSSKTTINSTAALTVGTKLICSAPNGQQINCTLLRNTQDGMLLEIPQQFYDSPERPQELSKTLFSFNFPSITRYEFSTRIVRYEIGFNGTPGLFISHSGNLRIQAQRGARRLDWAKKTSFYAVNITETKGAKSFSRKETPYECSILNISGDGCAIGTPLPIKQGQYIDLEIPLETTTGSAIGRIVSTRKLEAKMYALHIAFEQIDSSFRNEIFALTYGYV